MPFQLDFDGSTYRYLSIEQQYLNNAYRHEFRGYNWLELGYDDRAAGSFRKAKKNYEKAAALKLDPFSQSIVDRLCEGIASTIMYGDGFQN